MLELGLTILVWMIILKIAFHFWKITAVGIALISGIILFLVLGLLGILFWGLIVNIVGGALLVFIVLYSFSLVYNKAQEIGYRQVYKNLLKTLGWTTLGILLLPIFVTVGIVIYAMVSK